MKACLPHKAFPVRLNLCFWGACCTFPWYLHHLDACLSHPQECEFSSGTHSSRSSVILPKASRVVSPMVSVNACETHASYSHDGATNSVLFIFLSLMRAHWKHVSLFASPEIVVLLLVYFYRMDPLNLVSDHFPSLCCYCKA